MSASWNLLEDTMEAVNNVLGDFLIHQISHNSSDLSDVQPGELSREQSLEPQPRARSNTWPRRQFGVGGGGGGGGGGESVGLPQVNEETSSELGVGPAGHREVCAAPLHRKNSRRNPWGNCSYSDLIEQVQYGEPRPTNISLTPSFAGHPLLARQETDTEPGLRLAHFQRLLLQRQAGHGSLGWLEGEILNRKYRKYNARGKNNQWISPLTYFIGI